MYTCPNCSTEILRHRGPSGFYLFCPKCKGRSATIDLLRRFIPRPVVNSIWQMGQSRHFAHKRDCPCCNHKMTEVPTADHASADLVDVCARCQLVWFDDFEYENLPTIPESPKTEKTTDCPAPATPASHRFMGYRKPVDENPFGTAYPGSAWQWIPGFFGMPIEHEEQSLKTFPLLTWTLAALMVLATLLPIIELDQLAYKFGLIPSELDRYAGLTFITTFFLHGGLLHLFGNLYFLLVFGDNVEDELGKWNYGLFVLCASLIGSTAHILASPQPDIPLVGASAGISGIIAYYALKFPRAKLGFMFRFYILFKWFSFPAYALFIVWILFQMFLLWQQLNNLTNVSALAHLGGAVVGVALWAVTRKP